MNYPLRAVIIATSIALAMLGCNKRAEPEVDYSIRPVPFTSVRLKDSFWAPRIKKTVAIPLAHDKNTFPSKFYAGNYVDESEILRIIEGASYSLQTFPDIEQEIFIDTLISKLTFETFSPVTGKENSYYYGHLFDAAAAHYLATGKRTLIDAALTSADLILQDTIDFTILHEQGRVLAGLINLYRATGEKKYLDHVKRLHFESKSFIPEIQYENIEEQEALINEIYRHAAITEIAVLTNDSLLSGTIMEFWDRLVVGRMQITGGVGLSPPVMSADFSDPEDFRTNCEICASVADIILNQKLFLFHRQAKYYDIIEKILYNSVLPGMSLSGEEFLCINPPLSDGRHERSKWADGPLCRSEIVRLVPSLPGYIYAAGEKDIYVNLFISNDATIKMGDRQVSVSLIEKFPWEGKVEISVKPDAPLDFSLRIRIPGWAFNDPFSGGRYKFMNKTDHQVKITVNGINTGITPENGYAVLTRTWYEGDKIEIEFPMDALYVEADKKIVADTGKIAVQRGPLVYCAEWPDNNKGNILNLVFSDTDSITTEYIPGFLSGTQVIRLSGFQTKRNLTGGIDLLFGQSVTLIPYAFWNNRGVGQMRVWLPVSAEKTSPLPAATIAFRSKLSGNLMSESISALNDQIFPDSSNDASVPHYDWWPLKNQWVWVQYDFSGPHSVSKTRVYWFDNGPKGEFRVPSEWEMLYLKENIWTPVKTRSGYPVAKNQWNTVTFTPVIASSVKIKTLLKKGYSGGMYEWIIE